MTRDLDLDRELHLIAGEPEPARVAAARYVAEVDTTDPHEAARRAWRLGLAYRRSENPEAALGWLRDARERWRRLAVQPALLDAYRELGECYAACGRSSEAESSLRTSIQQARTFGCPAKLGHCLLSLGEVLARTERSDRALLALTEAASLLGEADEGRRDRARSAIRAISRAPGGAR